MSFFKQHNYVIVCFVEYDKEIEVEANEQASVGRGLKVKPDKAQELTEEQTKPGLLGKV